MATYAGIGSRRTPAEVLALIRDLAYRLAAAGWVQRTGGAPGADQAFYAGAMEGSGDVELYLPWPSYERDALTAWGEPTLLLPRPDKGAYDVAAAHHPGWPRLKSPVRALMARNSHQVLGATLRDPVRFVCCWTPDGSLDGQGRDSGGTGQALRLAAQTAGIEVFNLARPDHLERIRAFTARALA